MEIFREQNGEPRVVLEVLIEFNEEFEVWTAHCLDFDLIVDGASPEEVKESIISCINTYVEIAIEKNALDNVLRPARDECWEKLYAIKRDLRMREFREKFGNISKPPKGSPGLVDFDTEFFESYDQRACTNY